MSFEEPVDEASLKKRKMPLINTFPPPVDSSELTPTEQRVYLQLSLEFSIILEEAPSFQMGAYQWNLILPSRLQTFALTTETWEKLSALGDGSEELQAQLADLVEQFN
ncbi:hypothetical protein CEE45_10510 [Candidatus Heimdallarchaeota archaeon B3_Heim]|nr:MAG: hypothetical protein CEE45_10510 [Candidatus Heimdallarchaeota archaeon B3_Heim]